jgi:hypothetical protein
MVSKNLGIEAENLGRLRTCNFDLDERQARVSYMTLSEHFIRTPTRRRVMKPRISMRYPSGISAGGMDVLSIFQI